MNRTGFDLNTAACMAVILLMAGTIPLSAADWPRWRGSKGRAVADGEPLPVEWSQTQNVRWKTAIDGEGSSSPILWGEQVFVTSAHDDGITRTVHCLDRNTGHVRWSRSVEDDNPELSSALTGWAAPTPVTDGERVVAFFGNAGVVCYDMQGSLLWRRDFGDFESELGIASSPILFDGTVILVCDHDGNRFRTFDSFLIALDARSGETRWKTDRPGLERSWSTPIVVPAGEERSELVVNAQDELRGHDPQNGELLWRVRGMTGWVTPSPVFGDGLIFAASGRDGPTMAVRPGGRGDVTESHVVWQTHKGAPYVCSPLWYRGRLYVHTEAGILTCYDAATGRVLYRERLSGKFTASPVAGDGKVYLTNQAGTTFVIAEGDTFRQLAENSLGETTLASPAIAGGRLFLRTERHLYCIESP
ncbi:MAG: PQQ-binding-like beta-propeller repeat protein [Planctomycetaceae bacterium]